MKSVMGLDLSLTGTGAIVLDETGKVLLRETIKTDASMPGRQRIVKIADTVVAIVRLFAPVVIVKEAPAFGAAFAVHAIGQVHGAVDYAMEKAAQPLPLAVSPTTLKKFSTGRGVGEKSDVKMFILEKWHEKFSDNNQADAFVLARIAGAIDGMYAMTSKHEGECLKTILNGNGLSEAAKKIRLKSHDDRVCACGKKMKTGMEIESGQCAECLRKDSPVDGGGAQQ